MLQNSKGIKKLLSV